MKNYFIKDNGEKYQFREFRKGKIIWREGRSQGLDGAKGRIGNLKRYCNDLLKNKSKIKILEIGTGFGQALLELKVIFGDKIEICGTNYEKEFNKKLVKEYVKDNGFSIKEKDIPKIYILDAGKKLRFNSNSFDFVFCQATMQYIIDRALFIEEVNRILTTSGIGVLELQEFRNDHPMEHKEMIEIWKEKKKINFLKYLENFKNIKIKKSKGRDWHYIIMKKRKYFDLKLKLIKFIPLEDKAKKLWGIKVIFKSN
jgi:ubiquinone/menaquinone biosynthesis C-methylase UbiE